MTTKSYAKLSVLNVTLLCLVPLTSVRADLPNAVKEPVPLDYKSDPTEIHPANESPDLFGKSTGPLPFFGDEVRKRGYDLPDPFGVGYNYMNMRQNIQVNSIAFSGLKLPLSSIIPIPGLPTLPIPPKLINIKVGKTREKSITNNARFDTWLFPFMSIYGVVGHTKGSSVSNVSVCTLGWCPRQLGNIDFVLNFKGTTYGGGTTIAYGYHNWFGTLDFNYTRTNFDILDGSTSAFTFTPRIGYRFTVPGSAKFSIPVSHASIWVGSMYQNVTQDFSGNISNLQMPTKLVKLVNLVNSDDSGRFRVKQHLQSPWNILVGGQYELTRNFNVITEVGFEKRNSIMVGGEFRF